jgi:pimeloyl-ACP methyl ester carboxylesterase
VEYRGYGDSTGTPQFSAIMKDCQAIFEALKVKQEEIIVFGRSLGSIFALHFAHLYPK